MSSLKNSLLLAMQPDAAVQGVERELRAAFTGASAACAVAAIDVLAAAMFGYSRRYYACIDVKIAENLAVECFEKQIGRKIAREIRIERSVHGLEPAWAGGILREVNRDRAVHGVRIA